MQSFYASGNFYQSTDLPVMGKLSNDCFSVIAISRLITSLLFLTTVADALHIVIYAFVCINAALLLVLLLLLQF